MTELKKESSVAAGTTLGDSPLVTPRMEEDEEEIPNAANRMSGPA